MKKISLFVALLALSGCSSNFLVQVDYQQKGKDCIYVEQAGRDKSGLLSRTFNVTQEKVIRYPDTKCSTVIENELKSGANKVQTMTHSSRVSGTNKQAIH